LIVDGHDERRAEAVERLENRRDFRNHALVYVVVNTMLIVIWAASGAGYFWPIWSIAGWGIGLALHAWTIYGQRPFTEDDIREETKRLA
jgi:hypothetical protein